LANSNDALENELTSSGSNGTLSAHATLSDINAAISHGFVYTPNAPVPPTDSVSLKIQDSHGAIDEVNFVFNQGGAGPNVALSGGTGKDVLFGTGYNDTLTGGASSDTFVFRQFGNVGTPNIDSITDFNVFQDYLNLDQGHFANAAAVLAHTADVGGHAVITVDAYNSIALASVTTAQLSAHQDHILVA
jgi:Ca2+-binding RTX toxin-like protein